MENEKVDTEAAPVVRAPSLRKSLLQEVFEASTPSGQDAFSGREIFKRKRVTFLVPRDVCTADFPEDFELTLQELSADQEMACAASSTTPTEINMKMAKMAINGLNGAKVSSVQSEWLWDALGMGGRALVFLGFHTHLAQRGDEEGKAKLERSVFSARVE